MGKDMVPSAKGSRKPTTKPSYLDRLLTPVKKAARRAIEATIGSKDTQPDTGGDAPGSARDSPDVNNVNDYPPTVSAPTSANAGPANPPIDLQQGSLASSELPELTESVVSQPSPLIDQDPFNASPAIPSVLLHQSGRTGSSSMESFVQWLSPANFVITETNTIVYWCATTREKSLPLARKRSRQKSTLITVNHNKPDLVLFYMSSDLFDIWRLCMVIEAKPALNWGTAMAQIIVYMMKAFLMDGCTMGLVVAGTEYRFLFWSVDPNGVQRLYMVVPERYRVLGNSKSITFKQAVDDLTDSGVEWSLSTSDTSEQLASVSKRNLFRIFSHLERQTAAMDQRRAALDGQTGLAFDGCPPDLEQAKRIEITGNLWDHMPGSDLPATNGMGAPRNVDSGHLSDAGTNGEADQLDHDDNPEQGTDDATQSDDGLDDMKEETRALMLMFGRFQTMGRVKHQVDTWRAKTNESASPAAPGMVASTSDSATKERAIGYGHQNYTAADWDFIFQE